MRRVRQIVFDKNGYNNISGPTCSSKPCHFPINVSWSLFPLLLKLGRFSCMPQWIGCCRNDSAWLTSNTRSKKDNMPSIWFSLSIFLFLSLFLNPCVRSLAILNPCSGENMCRVEHKDLPTEPHYFSPRSSSLLNPVPDGWVNGPSDDSSPSHCL